MGFIAEHGLWTDEQRAQADAVRTRLAEGNLSLVRVAWSDPYGASRAKTLTLAAFRAALEDGHNINVATSTLDASGARVFASFTAGGGMGLAEMTGSPNLVVVPDPATFRVLPWEPRVGWILGDEYFPTGVPFHFSPRHLLRAQVARLAERGLRAVVGLEIEWYLYRLAEHAFADDDAGAPGRKGRAPRAYPIEPGYALHSESNFDRMQAPLGVLADALEALGLPLRSIENEYGASQVECTFAPRDALRAADDAVLFRSAVRQVSRRSGYLATFMCRPAVAGACSSGWHLHQSLTDAGGRNVFVPSAAATPLSELGMHYLGGLLEHAPASTLLANPTINGYRRFRPNSLAPDRIAWGIDHRGVMLRVLGGPGNAASRIENRLGEPAANPYLYIASQIVAGLDGIERRRDPGPPDNDPYATAHPMLPATLAASVDFFEREPLFAEHFGRIFVDYYAALKRREIARFEEAVAAAGREALPPDATTPWEQDEYFDAF